MKESATVRYTFLGIIFGLAFPIGATMIETARMAIPFNLPSLILIQQSTPLLWIIDTAPVFLGYFAFLAGKRQQKLIDQADNLELLVDSRSQEILKQKLFYETLVQNSPIAIVTLDPNHRIMSVNPAFQTLFGYDESEITGKELDSLIANPDSPQEANRLTREVLGGKPIREFGQRRCKDGMLVDVEIFGQPIQVNGHQIGVLGLYRDITVENHAKAALSASEERFRRMFFDSPIALRMDDFAEVKSWLIQKASAIASDLGLYLYQHPEEIRDALKLARIIDLNNATLKLFNAKDSTELQSHLHTILNKESFTNAIGILQAMMDGQTTLEREMVYNRLDGQKVYTITKLSILPGFEENWERVLFSNLDITERKMIENRLTYFSLHDILTGLYNRTFFEEEMARLEKSRYFPISIIVGDMDNLKQINDQFGHSEGDATLQNIAALLKKCFRAEDVVARIGGDEFAILLADTPANNANNAIQRIREEISRFNQFNKSEIPLSISLGSATASQSSLLDETFKTADEKMYNEKKMKKGAQ